MLDSLGNIGMGLIGTLAGLVPIAAGIWVGVKLNERGKARWVCWLSGGLVVISTGFLFWPAKEALDHARCKDAADYEECVSPTIEDWA